MVTDWDNSLSVHSDLRFLSLVDVFQSDLEIMDSRLTLLWPRWFAAASSAHAEHLAEDVVHVVAATTFLESIFSVLVVELPLFVIAESLVGHSHFLELLWVSTLIRVLPQGFFSESFLDLVFSRILLDANQFVEFLVVDFLRWASSARHATHVLEVSEGETTSATA